AEAGEAFIGRAVAVVVDAVARLHHRHLAVALESERAVANLDTRARAEAVRDRAGRAAADAVVDEEVAVVVDAVAGLGGRGRRGARRPAGRGRARLRAPALAYRVR